MKRLLFVLMAMIFAIQVWGQTPYTATIGSGTSTTEYLPIYGNYGYSYSQQIYTQPEINAKGQITKIRFYYSSGGDITKMKDWVVYLGHTTKTSFSSTTDWVPLSDLTQVFNGVIALPSSAGWMEIVFTAPFNYNNTDNLVVAIDENTTGYITTAWRSYTSGTNRSILYRDDTSNPDPITPPTASSRFGYNAQVQFEVIEPCLRPSAFASSNTTMNSSSFSWTNGTPTDASWLLYYKKNADTNYSSININSNPYTLTGLLPDNDYNAYLKTNCGADTSVATSIVNFTTLPTCPVPTTLNVSTNNLSAHAAILNWTAGGSESLWNIQYKLSSKLSWDSAYSITSTSNSKLLSTSLIEHANYDVRVRRICGICDTSRWSTTYSFLTPYAFPAPTNLANFDSLMTYSSAKIHWKTNGTETQWAIDYKLSTISDWNYATTLYSNDTTFILTGLTENTTYNVKVRAICGNNDSVVYSSPISLTTLYYCQKPTNFAVNDASITTTSAELSWISHGHDSQWTVEYKKRLDDWTTAQTVVASSNPYTLNGLQSGTIYNIRIKSICDQGESLVSNIDTCITACEIISSLPWSDSFDNNGTGTTIFPICWTKITTNSYYPYIATTNSSSPGSMNFSSTATTYNIAVTPKISDAISINTLRAKFKLYKTSAAYNITVGVISDPSNAATFDSLTTLSPTALSTWQDFEVKFDTYTGNGKYIAFRSKTAAANIIYLDNVQVSLLPTCFEPKNLASSNIKSSSANLTWTKGTTETKWEIEYKPSTDTNWANATTITTTIDTAFYSLTGLNELTTYNIRVKAICSASEESIYSNTINITTPATCPLPSALTATADVYSAIINWTAVGAETQWTIQYKISTDTNWANATSINIFSKPDTINGLIPLTTYNVRVKAICDQTHESIWTNAINFTTLKAPISTFPWIEGFETGLSAWTQVYVSGTNSWTSASSSSTQIPSSHGGTLFAKYAHSTTGNTTKLVSPVFDMTAITNPILSFWYIQKDWSGDQNTTKVYYRTSASSSWTQLMLLNQNISSWSNIEIALPNPSSSYQIAFEGYDSYGYPIGLDDVQISATPSCPKPTGLAVNTASISTSGAIINWTNGGTETAWTVQYKPLADTNWNNATNVIAATNPFTLTNLNQLTSYNVRIKANCSTNDVSLYSNIINFTTLPTCPIPTRLAFDTVSITKTSARIYWTAGGTETAWTVQYKLSTDTSWTSINATTNSYTITGLTHSSSYNARVKAVCSPTDESLWSNNINFSTIYSIPFAENFALTTFPPNNWKMFTGLDSAAFAGTQPTSITSGWSRYTSAYGLSAPHSTINIYGTDCKYWLVSPGIDLGSNSNLALTFDLALTAYNNASAAATTGTDDKFRVIISTDNGATWSQANSTLWNNTGSSNVYNNIPTTGQKITINLASYVNQTVKIAFYGESRTSNADNDLHIGNIKVDIIPTCFTPTALSATNNNTTSVDLNWTPSGSETAWTIQYKPSSDTNWTSATSIIATNDTISLTNLAIATNYDWRVKAVCSATDESPWSNSSSFATLSLTSSIPFVYDFDDNSLNSAYWIINNGTQTNKWFIGNIGGRTGNGLYVSNDGGSTLNYDNTTSSIVFASTKLQFGTAKNYALSFDWKAYGESTYDYINVYLMPTSVALVPGALPSSTYALATNINLDSTWKTKIITIPGTSVNDSIRQLVFVWKNDGSDGLQPPAAIDNIKVTDCVAPTGLLVDASTITSSGATIRWNAGNIETEWNVEYKLQNDSVWTAINSITDTNYTFTNIRHTSIYNVRVKSVCNSTTQSDDYSNIITINTACGAYDPLTLSTTFATMLPNGCWEKKVGLLTNSCTPTTTTGGWIASTVLPGYAKATMYRNNMSWLITPALDLGQGNIFYQLEFDAALTTFASINNPNYNNFDDKFILAISNDNGETWSNANVCKMYDQNGNPLLLNSLNPTPSHVFVKLVYDDGTPFTGNVKLGFYVESTIANAVNDLHINNISFSTYCPEPTAISTIPYTDRVDVRWTGNTNKNNLEIKLNGGTPIAINNVNNYTFNNLSQSNEYTVSVRTVCSNTNQYSEWVSNTFTTQVSPQVSTNDATEIAETSVTLNGYVTDGSEFISAKGFEYKKASETDWITVTATNQPLVYNLTGLDDGEDYEFRAFATTPSYPFYGDIKTFHTPVAPEVITDPSTEILQTSVTLNGSVTPGENPISNYGYEYRVVNANFWTILPINATPLTYTLSSLQTGTNYEYRAFATTTSGTTYGNVETFTTQTPVYLYTEDITNLSQNSATLNANLIQGSETISEFGFEWKATSATEYNIVPLTNINSLTYNLTSLLLNVSYDFRPYVVTPSGKFYSENKTFITLNPPTVLTTLASNLTSTSALLNATIIEGTDAMLAFGIEWKLASSQEWTTIPLTVSNPLTYELTGLSATTEYSYRAYSTVALTTIYGNTVNFTTLAEGINQPTVTTSQATNITQTLATISGNVTAGDKAIIEKGFEWKQANVPTWTVVPNSNLSFNFMDLAPGTSFNVRAYAITEDGKSYGSIETFNTLAAELVTMSISSISQTDANVSWAPINNAIGYRVNVYQAGVLINGYPQTLTSTTFDLTGLRSNTNFTVKIETQYTATRFSAFASNNFTTLQYPAPNVSITNTTQTSLTASWIANQTSGAKFNISLYQGETLVHAFTEQTATSMTLDLLNPSTTYTINVTEIYNTNELSVTATELNTTLATETPLVSDTTVVYNSVTINWSPMSNVISYKIYLYNENGAAIDSAFVNSNMNNAQGQERMHIGLHVTFIGLSSSTNYTAAIYGVYQGNVLSDPLLINFSTPYYEYPNPMYIKTSNVAPTSVTLNGRVSAGQEPTAIKGFLYKELGSTNWDSVVVAVADTNFTYNLTGLSINSLYQVRVFAKNPSGTFYSPILGFRTGRTNVIVPNATNRIIRNTADLIAASSYVNLGNTNVNLYFDVTVSPISGSGFTTSIGQTANFSGSIKFVDASNQEVIDGNITIDGLNIPLFHITSGAVIENINLTNVNITGRNASLIEYSDNTIIRNCNAENGTVNSTSDNAGGLVGEITNCSSVESCSANINVTGLNYVGGIVGNNASCAITKSYSTGDVAGNDYVGSFAGYNQGGTIFKSYSTGSVNSTTIPTVNVNFGAFVGGGNGNETKCYWLETILSNINTNIPNAIYNYRGTPKNAIEVIRAVD